MEPQGSQADGLGATVSVLAMEERVCYICLGSGEGKWVFRVAASTHQHMRTTPTVCRVRGN